MTRGEMKFALRVEGALNTIPEPEYRQLMVEALMVLSLAAEYEVVPHFGQIVKVENIVTTANKFFLIDQVRNHFALKVLNNTFLMVQQIFSCSSMPRATPRFAVPIITKVM